MLHSWRCCGDRGQRLPPIAVTSNPSAKFTAFARPVTSPRMRLSFWVAHPQVHVAQRWSLSAFEKCNGELTMKTLIATALVTLSLLSSAAQAATPFGGYPGWAGTMFEQTQIH